MNYIMIEFNTLKKIEHYLYNYNFIDIKIESLKLDICDSEFNQNYTRWIKNKSSSLEDQVIRNIEIERRILKINKWKYLITTVLEEYKIKNEIYYKFINLKYMCKEKSSTIQEKLNLSLKEQKDIRAEILQYIFFLAIKKQMLKEVNY